MKTAIRVLIAIILTLSVVVLTIDYGASYIKREAPKRRAFYRGIANAINRGILLEKQSNNLLIADVAVAANCHSIDCMDICVCEIIDGKIYSNNNKYETAKPSAAGCCRVAWVMQYGGLNKLDLFFLRMPKFHLCISEQIVKDKDIKAKFKNIVTNPCDFLYRSTNDSDRINRNTKSKLIRDDYQSWQGLDCPNSPPYDVLNMDVLIIPKAKSYNRSSTVQDLEPKKMGSSENSGKEMKG